MRTVALDMIDGSGDAIHHLGGNDGVEIFGAPVLLGSRLDSAIDRLRCLVAADFAAGIDQHLD
jgi:hypothetical protein